MQFKKLLLVFLLSFKMVSVAQVPLDFAFVLSERAVNKIFTAIGDVNGKNQFEILGVISGSYQWKVINPKINFKPDSSDFTCDAKVEVGPFSYKSQVIGNVKINYDDKTNLIEIKISKAIFEIYTMILKRKIHIKDIHLEDYFKEPFVFEGPKNLTTDMSITMPDSTQKRIYVQPTYCQMRVVKQAIRVTCDIAAQDQPFKPQMIVSPPIQNSTQKTDSNRITQ